MAGGEGVRCIIQAGPPLQTFPVFDHPPTLSRMNTACRILTMRAVRRGNEGSRESTRAQRGRPGWEYYTTCASNKTAHVTIMQKYLAASNPPPSFCSIPSSAFLRPSVPQTSLVFLRFLVISTPPASRPSSQPRSVASPLLIFASAITSLATPSPGVYSIRGKLDLAPP